MTPIVDAPGLRLITCEGGILPHVIVKCLVCDQEIPTGGRIDAAVFAFAVEQLGIVHVACLDRLNEDGDDAR